MNDLIKKILREETEEVLMIPGLHYFPDGVEGLKNFIQKKNITKWSLDDYLDLRWYEGDFTWFEGLVSISGYLDSEGKQIESLPNLQSVGGYLDIRYTLIESLDNLQSVGLFLNLEGTQIKSLPNLQSVGGNMDLIHSSIESLPNLQSVGGFLDLERTKIKSLPNLQSVGRFLDTRGTQIESLPNLKSVGNHLFLNKFLSKKYTDEEIRSIINIDGDIIRT
jgi:hypothetical protein